MEFALRDFQDKDFEILWSIDQRCFAPGIAYSRPELAAYIRRRGSFTLVAEKAPSPTAMSSGQADVEPTSGIVGFIVAAGSRGIGHIISIDVLPGSRRFGLGSKLLLAAEQRLRAVPCHTVVLETAVDNVSALAFYKRHLYHIVRTIPRYYSNGTNAFLLQKSLFSGTRDQ